MRATAIAGQITAVHVDDGPHLGPGECPGALVFFFLDMKTSRPPAPDITVTGGEL